MIKNSQFVPKKSFLVMYGLFEKYEFAPDHHVWSRKETIWSTKTGQFYRQKKFFCIKIIFVQPSEMQKPEPGPTRFFYGWTGRISLRICNGIFPKYPTHYSIIRITKTGNRTPDHPENFMCKRTKICFFKAFRGFCHSMRISKL